MSSSNQSRPPHHPGEVWHGLVSSRRQWARRTFTRGQLMDALKALVWVAPLTILIWFYAEREQLVSQSVSFPVAVKSADPGKIVTLLPPADRDIIAELTGPQARILEFKNRIQSPGREPAVVVEIDDAKTPVGQIQDLRAADLERLGVFRDKGIGIKNCQPAVLRVFVDGIEERELAVRVPAGLPWLESAVFDPPVVRVKGPTSVLDRLEREGKLLFEADMAGVVKAPGQHELPAVAVLRQFRDPQVGVAPATVKASIKVRQSDVEYKIPSMPIFITSPQGLLDKYKVVLTNPTLANVTVVGSPEKIAQLQQENFTPKPKATLEITREDGAKTGQSLTRRVRYELPEDITVKVEDAAREVEFKLLERSATE